MKQYFLNSLNLLPEEPGVYLFNNLGGTTLYLGKAKNIKKRVLSYFQKKTNFEAKTLSLISQISSVGVIPVESEFEALLLEAKLIKITRPKYNVIWKDDKHYIYIRITSEEFPRVLLSRQSNDPTSRFFGPFPSTRIIRAILSYIRAIFPYCLQSTRAKKPCFYTHLGLCNPCPAEIRKSSPQNYRYFKSLYRKNIRQIQILLQGKVKKVTQNLQKQMRDLAAVQDYEQAAKVRNKLKNLDYLVSQYQPVQVYIENPLYAEQRRRTEQQELNKILKQYFPKISGLTRIECYDVSNIAGKLATGSLVTFIAGAPAKKYYRRFKIRSATKPGDFRMLSEVMERRLRHADWELPDLLVVDGGQPQLQALKKVLKLAKLDIPLIGLAKKAEELVIPEDHTFLKLKLPYDSAALHLIQRLRDEAHRFAHKYHQLLRLKHLVSSASLD